MPFISLMETERMAIGFKNISTQQYELLLKFPAYVSLLAANADRKIDDVEKRSAIDFAQVKTYSCDPLLAEFFKEVDNGFERTLVGLDNSLPQGKVNRDAFIKSKLVHIERIVSKLEAENGLLYTKV